MIKHTAILLLVILVCSKNHAQIKTPLKDDSNQEPVYEKEIDFATTQNLRKDTVRYNHKYKYILTNINRFVYKEATAEQKGENLNTERPEILKAIKLPGFVTKNLVEVDPEKAQPSSAGPCECQDKTKIINSSDSLKSDYSRIVRFGPAFEKAADSFMTSNGINKALEKLKKNTYSSWEEICAEKRKVLADSLGLALGEVDEHNSITAQYVGILARAKKYLEDTCKPATERILEIIDENISKYKACLFNWQRYMRCLDSCCKDGKKNIIPCTKPNTYMLYEDSVITVRNCIKKLQGFADGLKEDVAEAEKAIELMGATLAEGKIDVLQENYNLLVHQNFQLELETFEADKDVHEIIFTTGAEGPLVFGKPAKRVIKIKAVTYGGWKVDYSAGVFMSFGNNKFLGPDYYFEDSSSGTSKAIREVERTKGSMLSIGALMHIYPRLNFTRFGVRPGLALGVSTTAGFDALNFHGGLSFIIGKPGEANRVIISAGFTFREVNLLDSRYKLNEFKSDYPDEVPTSKNFPVRGTFISLTYNLLGVNK